MEGETYYRCLVQGILLCLSDSKLHEFVGIPVVLHALVLVPPDLLTQILRISGSIAKCVEAKKIQFPAWAACGEGKSKSAGDGPYEPDCARTIRPCCLFAIFYSVHII